MPITRGNPDSRGTTEQVETACFRLEHTGKSGIVVPFQKKVLLAGGYSPPVVDASTSDRCELQRFTDTGFFTDEGVEALANRFGNDIHPYGLVNGMPPLMPT